MLKNEYFSFNLEIKEFGDVRRLFGFKAASSNPQKPNLGLSDAISQNIKTVHQLVEEEEASKVS